MTIDTSRLQLIGMRSLSLDLIDQDTFASVDSEIYRQVGGKAHGLLSMFPILKDLDKEFEPAGIHIGIPGMTILCTGAFDMFIQQNDLGALIDSDVSDNFIHHAFQKADMPFEILGELRSLIENVNTPLAVRSSGLLEDVTQRPFAGVYLTKMIPNNQYNVDIRFEKLVQAIKAVWASTYCKTSKDYCKATGLDLKSEKMAVIIQDLVGKRYSDRFYPEISGVARSYNYYPVKPAKPEDGVVNLALGLGKTIVDGGRCWFYSPSNPQKPPPFASTQETLDQTQNNFWVVNLGEPPEYDPIRETEFMLLENITMAEEDGTLDYLVSTFQPETGYLSIGTGVRGPRVLTFAPLLLLNDPPITSLIKKLLDRCEEGLQTPVEIEFAMTFDPPEFSFLQVRPMVVPKMDVQIDLGDLTGGNVFIASEMVLGNGVVEGIQDVVYVKPDSFNLKHSKQIAEELEVFNNQLLSEERPYLLIVFGRLGTFDPWLGIPVTWGKICGAKVIVEATQENVNVELSQGTHYFHNIINLGVIYFSMPLTSPYKIDWDWLEEQNVVNETDFICHIRLAAGMKIIVDGRNGRGIVYKS